VCLHLNILCIFYWTGFYTDFLLVLVKFQFWFVILEIPVWALTTTLMGTVNDFLHLIKVYIILTTVSHVCACILSKLIWCQSHAGPEMSLALESLVCIKGLPVFKERGKLKFYDQ
jgi:hypothetical protein